MDDMSFLRCVAAIKVKMSSFSTDFVLMLYWDSKYGFVRFGIYLYSIFIHVLHRVPDFWELGVVKQSEMYIPGAPNRLIVVMGLISFAFIFLPQT